MRKLTKPTEKAEDVFLTCISNIRSSEFKLRLESCQQEIKDDSQEFENKVVNSTLHKMRKKRTRIGSVSKEEMIKIYSDKMVGKKSPGRAYYDKWMTIPLNDICPLCGQRTVSTLDHHLAKTDYLSLVVTPVNLIPACKDCNTIKLAISPSSSEEETLHPYFDDIENERWLYAEVEKNSPVTLRFFIDNANQKNTVKAKRIQYHFKTFGLSKLYSSHAGSELINNKYCFSRLFDVAGADAVRNELLDRAASYERAHKNSWQTAMYYALAENDWYCSGGVIL